MRVVGVKTLEEFCARHADVRNKANAWKCEAEEANWQTSQDIKERYPPASFLSGNQVVFNLKGNDYRLLAKIDYRRQIVLIKGIWTHSEYDKWLKRRER